MRRFATVLALISLVLALVACGGGGSGTATPGGDNSNTKQKVMHPIAPESVVGSHAVSVVPDQLNVVTGLEASETAQLVQKYGYHLLYQNGSTATIEVPSGTNLDQAAAMLEKEYSIVSAEPVRLLNTPRMKFPEHHIAKAASFTPLDPFYGDETVAIGFVDTDGDGTPDSWGYALYNGQAQMMNMQGFNGAWDVALNNSVATQPVTIAIIDAGWFDYSVVNRPSFDETLLDANHCGSIAGDGTLTPGLAAAAWLVNDDGDPATADYPYRDTGEKMLGILAADINGYMPQAIDFAAANGGTPDGISSDDIWNEGIAGINPTANYVLIKTGSLNVDTWSFSDNEIAEAIKYAAADTADTNGGKWPNGGANADIVLLGMFAVGDVSANISAAIQTARDNNVLVIAPAGDVVDSYDAGGFTDTPVNILTTHVTPASDVNIVSVAATGYNRIGALDPIDFGEGPIDNVGRGWTPGFGVPFDDPFYTIAQYSNTGASIAGIAYAIGFSFHPYLVTGGGVAGDPQVVMPGENFVPRVDSFSTSHAAAYVAGAASQIFQTLYSVNGTPPTDDEVLNELMSSVQFAPLTGLAGNGGLLNASAAMDSAINGGNLITVLPALNLSATLSQPLAAVTRGTDLVVTPHLENGTGPFSLEIDWDNGDAPVVVDPWVNDATVTLTGGYDTLGLKGLNITVTDSNDLSVNLGFAIHVINPLTASISISNADGVAVPLANLKDLTPYRFSANAANVYTGDLGGVPNTTTYSWDFNGDSVEDATGPNPSFQYPPVAGVQNYTITLTITEAVRPDTVVTADVTVSPS